MEDLSRFCCLNLKCPDYGKRGAGNLTCTARHGKNAHLRMLRCRTCKDRFSERKGTPFFDSRLPPQKCLSLLEHLSEGVGVRKTARLIGTRPDTVSRYNQMAGGHARKLHEELVAFSPSYAASATGRAVVVRGQKGGPLRQGRPGRRLPGR